MIRTEGGERLCWAAQWHSANRLDGRRRYILYGEDYLPKLFRSRKACREWIISKYGYIADRPNLQAEPHGWRMPQAVQVGITVLKTEKDAADKWYGGVI